jgi:hypothetical protein
MQKKIFNSSASMFVEMPTAKSKNCHVLAIFLAGIASNPAGTKARIDVRGASQSRLPIHTVFNPLIPLRFAPSLAAIIPS